MENRNGKLGLILFLSLFSRTIKLKKNDSADGSIDRNKGNVNSLHSPRHDVHPFSVI